MTHEPDERPKPDGTAGAANRAMLSLMGLNFVAVALLAITRSAGSAAYATLGGATLLSLAAGYHGLKLLAGKVEDATPAHRQAAAVLLLGTVLIAALAVAALVAVARRGGG